MSRTLYVSDMDGTLLNNGSYISADTSDIISDLSRRGALITVATARTPATVVPLMEGTYTHVPYIVMTGAATFDSVNGTYRHTHKMPPENARLLAGLFGDADIHPFVYHYADAGRLLVYHRPAMTEAESNFYSQRRDLRLKRFTFEEPWCAYTDVALCFALGARRRMCELAERIDATGLFSVSCYPDIFNADMQLLEVFDAGVSKAGAVTTLAESISADRVVVFGDNLNDLPMFEVADVAVAVANAHPAVRDAADVVIGPNYDDSVAHFIADDFTPDKI